MQLVDELSMIYTTCLMFYATFSHGRAHPIPLILGIALVALSVFITGYYHYLQDPTFHQNAYALLTATLLFRAMYIMEVSIRPYFRAEQRRRNKAAGMPEQEQARQDKRDALIVKQMWMVVGLGVSIFLGGFGVWTLDNVYCGTLRRWRREIGLPWGILLEGHGWWHLMTGCGAYFWIVWGIWLRHCLNGKQDDYELVWPSLFSLPVIQLRDTPVSPVGGSAKKEL